MHSMTQPLHIALVELNVEGVHVHGRWSDVLGGCHGDAGSLH